MKNKFKKAIIVVAVISLLFISKSVFSAPGSEVDPLVTKGYVDSKIWGLKTELLDKIEEIKTGSNDNSQENQANGFRVVNVKKGQYIIGDMGTELILRFGRAKGYNIGDGYGLSNITDGSDINNTKDELPLNNLIIFPRNDGRGLYILEDAIFLVKGSYSIK